MLGHRRSGTHDSTGDQGGRKVRDNIRGNGLSIRPFHEDDAERLHAAATESVEQLAPFETWCHAGYSLDEAREYVGWWIDARENGSAFYYVVEDTATGRFLGVSGLTDYCREHRHAELGYWVRTSETGRGVATAAARLIVDSAFADLDLLRVAIGVPVGNDASHRVVAKLGAVREGVLRSELVLPGGPTNVVLYGLLRGELRLQ